MGAVKGNSSERSNSRVLLSTSIGAFTTPFTSSVISFSVPEIGHDLHSTFVLMIWVPMAYLITLPSLMILFGRLSDTFGRSRLFMAGLAVFGAGSILASLSPGPYFLIFSTTVMGIGSSLVAVNAIALVSAAYPPESRGGALGITVMSVYVGLALGPILSGILIGTTGWRFLFYMVSGIAFMSLIPSYVYLRRVQIPTVRRRMDIPGFITFFLSILSIVLYLSLSEIYGWLSAIYLLGAGLGILAVFVFIERSVSHPLLDLSFFTHNRTFTVANVTALFLYISTYAIILTFSIYLTVVAGLQPMEAGLIIAVEPVFMVILSPIMGRVSDRIGSRTLASGGMFVISAAFFSIYLVLGKVPPVFLAVPLSVVGIGFGLFSAPNTSSIMGAVSKKDSGTASGTLGTMRFVGQLMSLAVMGSILAQSMPRNLLLKLFTGIGGDLTTAQVSGFLSGLGTVMLLSGILCLAGGVISLMRKRTS